MRVEMLKIEDLIRGHYLVPTLSLVLLEACYDMEDDGKEDDAGYDEDWYDQSYSIEVLSH